MRHQSATCDRVHKSDRGIGTHGRSRAGGAKIRQRGCGLCRPDSDLRKTGSAARDARVGDPGGSTFASRRRIARQRFARINVRQAAFATDRRRDRSAACLQRIKE